MNNGTWERTELLLGEDALKKLSSSRVAVFGLGGVGGFAAEALVRCSVGSIDIIDNDKITKSNINRQIYALNDTVGLYKADVAFNRIKSINPDINVKSYKTFYSSENSKDFDFKNYDYIVDAIDTVSSKIELILNAKNSNVPIISSMGAGNKLDPSLFEVADIYETSVCPLARVMRRELRKRGIENLKVVYSKEKPVNAGVFDEEKNKAIPGSVSFVPSVMGLIIASEVVKDIINS